MSWDGEDLAIVAPHERRFGLMFQEYALFPHRDVAGNVEFGLRMASIDRGGTCARVAEVLDAGRSRRVARPAVTTLSGGEQQRVALARALAVSPRLLMLDEPLGALDRVWRRRLLDEIRAILDQAGLPALYVTHDHEEAFAIATRVAIMRDGRVVQLGPPAEVWRAPVDVWTAAFLGFGPIVAAGLRDGARAHALGRDRSARGRRRGGPVDVVVRPDGRALDAAGPIDATIVRADVHRYACRAHGGVRTRSAAHGRGRGPGRAGVGDRVRLSIDPDSLLVFPRRAE